ncbi:MAG: hypothetical protein A4E49_02025 [Methanosaeta sp. PtaU1.Bin112]|nr:MAG: hypothetical protein A4E49_02025 [Methanosaeta sp. PtaU1.Bin112]
MDMMLSAINAIKNSGLMKAEGLCFICSIAISVGKKNQLALENLVKYIYDI